MGLLVLLISVNYTSFGRRSSKENDIYQLNCKTNNMIMSYREISIFIGDFFTLLVLLNKDVEVFF